jgi:murein tripeptide amidase MpaA
MTLNLKKKKNFQNNRALFIESTIHAREWITPATTTYIINQLLTSNDPNVQEIANYVDWYIIPIGRRHICSIFCIIFSQFANFSVNPDGYVHTWTSNRNWRKTRSAVSTLCFGVDGNRNFAFNWLTPDETGNEGGSRIPCTDTYGIKLMKRSM